MIAWLLPVALAGDIFIVPQPPAHPAPPPPEDAWGVVDLGDIVVVRPIGDVIGLGYDLWAFDQSVSAALQGRDATYDFVMVLNSDRVPDQMGGAGAFYSPYNSDAIQGTGGYNVSRSDMPVNGALWMSRVNGWDWAPQSYVDWVFGQELGHYWLAFPEIDRGGGPETLLLGRANSHWSYFMDTGSSPVEGNTWIDHGDGTFSTDPGAGLGGFCDLDLYLMGLLAPEDVAPFFVIEPGPEVNARADWGPDAAWSAVPTTIEGTRIDLTVDDVIAAEGLVAPGPDSSDRVLEILTVLVVGPRELFETDMLDKVAGRQAEWAAAWASQTRGLSEVDFGVVDDGLSPPVFPTVPTLVPRGAW